MDRLLKFLDELERRKICYQLSKQRDAIMVNAWLPGKVWEAEFFANGEVEVEVYASRDGIEGDEAHLYRLLDEVDRDEASTGEPTPNSAD